MIYVSRKGRQLLEKKLEQIDEEIADTYKKMGESTKIDNDLRENPEYLELQTKVSYNLPRQRSEVMEVLRNCVIVEEQDFYKNYVKGTIIINSEVTILFNGKKNTYSIVGYGEADPFINLMSYDCELAKCLLGRKVNEEVTFRNGTIKILDVKLIENKRQL